MVEIKKAEIVTLQEKDVQLVVSQETIGQLTTNIKEVKERVEKALPMYDISHYSSDDIPKCKADKALLNKAAKALDDKRKELEKAWLKPFDEFKTTCNETRDLIKNAVLLIDGIIKQDDERTKVAKREEIEKIAEKCGVEDVGVKLDAIFDNKWLNKSTSLKSIEKDITSKVEGIRRDLETLKTFSEDYDVLCTRYRENLNLQETIVYANRLKEQREMASQKKEEEAAPTPPPVVNNDPSEQESHEQTSHSSRMSDEEADAADAFAAAMGQAVAPPTPSLVRVYTVEASEDALDCLEKYMKDNNINFDIR